MSTTRQRQIVAGALFADAGFAADAGVDPDAGLDADAELDPDAGLDAVSPAFFAADSGVDVLI